VHPAPVAAVGDETRVLEGLEVEREQRLSRIERVGELAHAPLAGPQPVEDAQSERIGERFEASGQQVEVVCGSGGHGPQYINNR